MNKHRDIDKDQLLELAYKYCDSCIDSVKQVATVKGPVDIKERHLPTIRYFLSHYLRKEHFAFYQKSNWYDAMKDKEHPLSDTIKNIDELFESLAVDIVANEGKGIFYAKNKLGMSDKIDNNNTSVVSGKVVIVSPNSTGIPLVNNEKDVNLDH